MAKKEPKGITAVYDPAGKELELRKRVYERYYAMKDTPERNVLLKKWDDAEKQWEAYREEKKADDWQSNHYVPLTTAIVETALSELIDQTPRPLFLPRSTEDAPKAALMRHIFEYTWEVADGDTQLYNVMKDTLMYGTAIGQEYYLKDRRMIKMGEDKTEVEVYDYDDVMMEIVKLQDFFVDEKARSFNGPYAARDCIRRYIMDIEDFRLFFNGPIWDPLKNANKVKPGGDINYYEFFKPSQGIDLSKEVEVLWYWSKKPEDLLVITANDVVVKFGPNPHAHKQLPFGRSVDIKRVHSFYGKGEPELLESIQDELNTLRRMILDRNHLDIDKMFIASDTLNLNDEDLAARPHGLIPTSGDINSVKAIEYGDIPRSVELSLNQLNEDAIVVTGVDPRMATRPQPATATEAALLKEAALKKIRMKLRLLEREFLVRIGMLRVANILQFYSQPTLERIVGEKGTLEYQAQLNAMQQEGTLQMVGGEPFAEKFRQMRMEGRKMEIGQDGMPVEVPSPGFHFFELRPEFFIPAAKGGFDIKFAAGATLPISKPLLQTKTTEMYDRLIQLALAGIGYDPVKLGDALLKVNDLDPADFKKSEEAVSPMAGGEGMASPEQEAKLAELANEENRLLMEGQPVPPTPYSSQPHSLVHIEFMRSPQFQETEVGEEIVQNFTTHITGELMAQQQRGGQAAGMDQTAGGVKMPSYQGQGTRANPPQAGGNVNNPLKNIIPGKIQGGADIPQVA